MHFIEMQTDPQLAYRTFHDVLVTCRNQKLADLPVEVMSVSLFARKSLKAAVKSHESHEQDVSLLFVVWNGLIKCCVDKWMKLDTDDVSDFVR